MQTGMRTSPDMIAVANRGGEWDETRGLLARLLRALPRGAVKAGSDGQRGQGKRGA